MRKLSGIAVILLAGGCVSARTVSRPLPAGELARIDRELRGRTVTLQYDKAVDASAVFAGASTVQPGEAIGRDVRIEGDAVTFVDEDRFAGKRRSVPLSALREVHHLRADSPRAGWPACWRARSQAALQAPGRPCQLR